MKKILALLIVFISLPFAGWALDVSSLQCQNNPINRQLDNSSPTPTCYVNNAGGAIEFVAYFNTGAHTNAGAQTWKNFLTKHQNDIGRIIIVGAADAERTDGNIDANITLAQNRARWAVDNVVPDSIKNNCKFNGAETDKCALYVMGDSDDRAVESARDKNAGARSVAIWVIWRQAICPDAIASNIEQYKQVLSTCGITENNEWLESCEKGLLFLASESEDLLELLLSNKCPDLIALNKQTGLESDTVVAKIDAFLASLGLTVWRDADGKFNTARLASDSIAAVVLGTAGGIITSKLVKKSQIKKGFEDLNCSIGGQRVSDFGDEFTVGLQ